MASHGDLATFLSRGPVPASVAALRNARNAAPNMLKMSKTTGFSRVRKETSIQVPAALLEGPLVCLQDQGSDTLNLNNLLLPA